MNLDGYLPCFECLQRSKLPDAHLLTYEKMNKKNFGVSQNVLVLSLVSLLNDFAGETIKRTLPLFLVNIAGVGTSVVGVIEGMAESIATLVQAPAGRLSDIIYKRKIFVLLGRILQVSRVFLIFPQTALSIGFVRLFDRAGKGLGTAPRDALISDSTQSSTQGRAFGFLRAADSAGAVLGLLVAAIITWQLSPNLQLLTPEIFKIIVAIGAVPTILNVLLIGFFVKEVKNHLVGPPLLRFDLGKPFKVFLAISIIFTLGTFSEAFLILRAQSVGIPLYQIFIILAVFSAVTSIVFLPAGILSDKLGRKRFIILGWLTAAFAFTGFAVSSSAWHIWIFYLLFGVYFGMTEGVAKAFIVDLVPVTLKATAFGVYNTFVGATLFPASVVAGVLWQTVSPSVPFYFGAVMATLAAILLLFFKEKTYS